MNAEQLYQQLLEQLRSALLAEGRTPFLIGVHTGGAWVAERLHQDLGLETPLGFLSSAFHRDDFNERGLPGKTKPTQIKFDVNGADLIVVDDILYTGRTMRAVMNELYDFGRAARIELAVLLDRGGRELPFAARYCGGVHPLDAGRSYVLSMQTSGSFELKVD